MKILFVILALTVLTASCAGPQKQVDSRRNVTSLKDLEKLKEKISPQSVAGVLSSEWDYNNYVIYLDSNGREHMDRHDWIKTTEIIKKHPEVLWDYSAYKQWTNKNSTITLDEDNWEFTMNAILNSFPN